MVNRRRTLPPVSPKTPPELRPLVAAIAEIIETGEGVRGDPLDRKVTLRELTDAGVLKLAGGGSTQVGDSVGIPTTTVGKLSNLTANGAFQNIILAWEGINQSAYSHTEIWRADDDNLANAVLVGVTPAAVYVDPVSDYRDFYYWVRAVSTSDNPGPYNATAGTVARISPDYETVRDFITATEWQASTAYSPLDSVVPTTEVVVDDTKIRLLAVTAGTTGASEPNWATAITAIGDTVVDGSVTWEAVEAGKIPFFIDPASGLVVIDGAAMRDASIDNAKIGSLAADKIYAASGTIADALIGAAEITNAMITNIIQSNNYVADTSGWIINKNGFLEAQNAKIRGHIEADTGYIADTLQIGGTAYDMSQLVTMAEDGDTSTFENWIRPGTTLIDGNKIYTGDAYVDTLQIKGNAITAISAQSGGSVSTTVQGTFTVHSVSVAMSQAGKILINAGGNVFAGAGWTSETLFVTLNGSTVASWAGGTGVRAFTVAPSVGAGTHSIVLKYSVSSTGGGSSTGVNNAYLAATGAKR